MKWNHSCPQCRNNNSRWAGWESGKHRRECNECGFRGVKDSWEGKIMPMGDLTFTNREVLDFELQDFYDVYESKQSLDKKTNTNQRVLNAKIDTKKPIILQFISDLHIGNPSINIQRFKDLTEYILDTENLYVGLLGDNLDTYFASAFMSKPYSKQIFPAKQQIMMLDKWLNKINHKILFATWDNHSIEREERRIGWSPVAELQAKYAPYFDGIGRVNLTVGEQEYEIVVSHAFKGKSKYNPLHGLMSFCREQVQTGDVYAQGDKHQCSFAHQTIGDKDRVFIMTGTLEENDDFTERYFSLFPKMEMPAVVLFNDRRKMHACRTSEDGGIYIQGLK